MIGTKFIASCALAIIEAVSASSDPGAFFQSKTVIIPHDTKIDQGGEDSADCTDTVLTVADGVGSWALRGINPGLFSAKLTNTLVELSSEDPDKEPKQLISEACSAASSEFQGSATVVALELFDDMIIKAANLGDSGYALFHVKPNDTLEMYFRSPSQQYSHNLPY